MVEMNLRHKDVIPNTCRVLGSGGFHSALLLLPWLKTVHVCMKERENTWPNFATLTHVAYCLTL